MKLLLTIMLFLIGQFAYSQTKISWLVEDFQDILTKRDISIKLPDGFKNTESDTLDWLKDNPRLEKMFDMIYNKFISEDRECLISLPLFRLLAENEADSIQVKKSFPNLPFTINGWHVGHLAKYVFFGKDLDYKTANLNDHLTYYSKAEALSKFNADTAVVFTMVLKDVDAYKGKFNNVEVILLQKNGRGLVSIVCLFTDKAKLNWQYYKDKIESIYYYN